MVLLGSTKKVIGKNKNGRNMPQLVLIHCNTVKNDYQQGLRVLHTSLPYKLFGQLLDILSKIFIFLKIFKSNF